MWIERELAKVLPKYFAERPVVILTGARQTGKTSLLHNSFPQLPMVSLDLPSIAEEAENAGDTFLAKFKPPVIIDEVQYAPGLFRYIKHAVDSDRQKNGRFLLSGSQKFPLMKNVAESLAGRVTILHLQPLSLKELYGHKKKSPTRANVLDFICRGGYPEIYQKQLDPGRFFSDYTATYLERDLRQIIQVRDLRQFNTFMRLCASRIGQLISASALAADTGITVNTAQAWLAALEASNIILLLKPYFMNLGKRLVKAPKLYFMDTGLAAFLNGIQSPQELLQLNLAGPFFENHVVTEAYKAQSLVAGEGNLFYYRDHHGREVDLVLAKGAHLHLLECKLSDDAERDTPGFREIVKLVGPKRVLSRTIITPARAPLKDRTTGIEITNSFDFDYWAKPK